MALLEMSENFTAAPSPLSTRWNLYFGYIVIKEVHNEINYNEFVWFLSGFVFC